ncbi:MAG: DUF2057 family protein [Thiohalomonadales bacterium]
MTNLKTRMNYRNSIFIFLLATLTACASDDISRMYEGDKRPDTEIARIMLPGALQVIEVNNKKIKTPYQPDGYQSMDFLPGRHIIRVFYKEYWGAESGGGLEVSDIFDFDVTLDAGKEYVFQHNGPDDLIDANIESSINDIKIWLYQPDTKTKIQPFDRVAYGNFISHSIRSIATTAPAAQKSTPQTELEQLQSSWKMADDRQRNTFKTWVTNRSLNTKPATETTPSAAKTPASEKATENDAYQQLEHWWKMADDKQRKAFSDWIANRSLDGKGLL